MTLDNQIDVQAILGKRYWVLMKTTS
jgi:hypothetical protein